MRTRTVRKRRRRMTTCLEVEARGRMTQRPRRRVRYQNTDFLADQILYPEAKALAEKQAKEAMAMAQAKCSIS